MRHGKRERPVSALPTAASGVRWTVLTYGVGKVITLAATIVLARILVPADFGVVMLAFVAINVIGLFGDLGLGATLVVRQDLGRRDLGTALTLLLASGTVLGLVLAGIAPWLSSALGEPRLRPVLTAMAPITVLGSVTWFYQWLLQRELDFRSRFFGFLAHALAYSLVAVGAAALGAGVWSIVAGHLAAQAAMAAVFVSLGRPVWPRFDARVARSLLRSSRGFLLRNAAMLAQQNADYVAVGHVSGSTSLGFYSMAYRLSELPHLAVADPVTKVTFPAFSRMRANGEEVAGHYLATLRLVALVTCPWAALLSAASAPFTTLVYGTQWIPMIGALTVLALWGAGKSVHATVEWFLSSVGGADAVGLIAAAVVALQVPALFLAADRGGIVAVAWVLVGGLAVSLSALLRRLHQRVGLGACAHGAVLWPVLVASAAAWASARMMTTAVESPLAAACLASMGVGAGVYVTVISWLAPGSLRAVGHQLRQAARGEAVPSSGP